MTSMTSALLTHRFLIFILIHLNSNESAVHVVCRLSCVAVNSLGALNATYIFVDSIILVERCSRAPVILSMWNMKFRAWRVDKNQNQQPTYKVFIRRWIPQLPPEVPKYPTSKKWNAKWIETFKYRAVCVGCRCNEHVPVFARRFRRQTGFFPQTDISQIFLIYEFNISYFIFM